MFVEQFIALKARCPRMSWEINRAKESPLLEGFYAELGEQFFAHLENSTELKIPRNDSVLALGIICGVYDVLFTQVRSSPHRVILVLLSM